MSGNWITRAYRAGDEERIISLYRLVFRDDMDLQHWNWRYKQTPVGLVTVNVAETQQRLVGQYALRPVRMKVGASVCTAALSLDTMVHPDYRGQGMFVKLAANLYESVARQGINLVYGFPNENSHHGIVARLGWVDLAKRAPLLVRPLQIKNILAARFTNGFWLSAAGWLGRQGFALWDSMNPSQLPPNCSIEQLTSFDERFDALWQSASSALSIAVVRDSRYLNWRYVEKPDDSYCIFTTRHGDEVLGYIVLKEAERFGLRIGFLVDLLAVPSPPDLAKYLVSHAVQHFNRSHVDIVSCLMFNHGPYAQALRSNGFLPLPIRLHPQEMYVGVRPTTNDYPAEFVTNPRNWHITWGDHDDI